MADYTDFFWTYVMVSLEMFAGFYFFMGFLQKKVKKIYGVLFAILGTIILAAFRLEGIFAVLVFIMLLMAAGKLICRENCILIALYAVVTIEILNLCFGLFNSLSYILFPIVYEKNHGSFGFVFAGVWSVFSMILAVLCYQAIRRYCICNETPGKKYVFMILMPVLLIFLASEYINEIVYGNTVTIEKGVILSGVNPYQMLLIQTLGVASLFCIMFSYKKLAEGFRLNKEAALLEMQALYLSRYVEEAKLRYEKTKSFRHDIKNHIMVIRELLQDKKTEAALQYVEGMEEITADISFPVSTNNPVLDILLGNKLGIAKENGIEVQCSMLVPYPCGISDTDFCIILGNALDNAVSACNRICNGKQKYIHVTGKIQGDFLLIEIENSYIGGKSVRGGTGLTNIRTAVEKYHGAMEIRTEGEIFVLRILVLNHSASIRKHFTTNRFNAVKVMTNKRLRQKKTAKEKEDGFMSMEVSSNYNNYKNYYLERMNEVKSKALEAEKGQDENGSPKVLYDNPQKCTSNTDKVDREIKKLKEQKQQLEQQIKAASGDEEKIKELEKKLSRIEEELSQKDNDTYRRQNAVIS